MLQFMENSKSQLLWEEMQQQEHYQGTDSIHKRIRLLEQAQRYYRKEALQTGGSDSLLKLREQRVAWDLATLRKKIRPAAAIAGDQVSTDSITKLLAPGQLIRTYFAGNNTLYTVELDNKGIRYTDKQAINFEAIRDFKQHYFEEGAQAMTNTPKAYYNAAYRLYMQIFATHPLRTNNTYILMPDGVLSTLPAEALVTDSTYHATISKWPFLIKQATISYAYSLRTWQSQMLADANKKGFSGFFISQQQGLADLQGVTKEKELMTPVIAGGNWYVNEQATTASFRQGLTQSAIVHISTHAFIKKDNIAAPHIVLYDAPFYLFELDGLQQHPAMVVLSACRTGDGRLVTGEGIQSLAHAFMGAGTPAVVAASWNVNDATAPQLMQQFYKLLSTQKNAAVALQQAKLNWLNDGQVTDMHKLPYYWAALNYQGNTQAMVLAPPRHSWYWWLVLLLVPLFAYIFSSRKLRIMNI
ncbi:CHAT domain-containing protein [Chitinophaga niastensis]